MGSKVISVHIPKTAGTSFRKTLEHVYGERLLSLYDDIDEGFVIPKEIDIIHGHLISKDVLKLQASNPEWQDAQLITWIREPVSRFVSNYFYLREVISEKIKSEKALARRMIKTLDEYLAQERECNRMNKYFDTGLLNMGNVTFVGETEQYDQDLHLLAQKLQWREYRIFHNNKTSTKEPVDERTLEQIALANEKDLSWYGDMKKLASDLSRDFEAPAFEPVIVKEEKPVPVTKSVSLVSKIQYKLKHTLKKTTGK